MRSIFRFILPLFPILAVACSSVPPPPPTPPIAPDVEPTGAPIAVGGDPATLRPTLEQQRDRLRDLIDVAERRELHEGGPRMLRAAKEEARRLDAISARIDDTMRAGSPPADVDEIHAELQLEAARLDRLDHALH